MTQGKHMRWTLPLSLLIWTAMPVLAQSLPHVYTGRLSCELKQVVVLQAHPEHPGQFQLRYKKKLFNLTPSPGMSGVVRLEDASSGIIWMQLNAKSMLLDETRGVRLVDECQHPTQKAMADAMKLSPPANLLDTEASGR